MSAKDKLIIKIANQSVDWRLQEEAARAWANIFLDSSDMGSFSELR